MLVDSSRMYICIYVRACVRVRIVQNKKKDKETIGQEE